MQNITDMRNTERNRDLDDLFKIYIYITTENEKEWERMYDFSAYLYKHLPAEFQTEVTPKHIRYEEDEYGAVRIGWPSASHDKYMKTLPPDEKNEYCYVYDVKDLFADSGITVDNFKEKLDEWKNQFECKVIVGNKKKNAKKSTQKEQTSFNNIPYWDNNANIVNNNGLLNNFTSLAKEISVYEVENSTPNDNTNFILKLKRMTNTILYGN